MMGGPGDVKYMEMSDLDQYTAAMYYTFTTITTVGYGDISGTNT